LRRNPNLKRRLVDIQKELLYLKNDIQKSPRTNENDYLFGLSEYLDKNITKVVNSEEE